MFAEYGNKEAEIASLAAAQRLQEVFRGEGDYEDDLGHITPSEALLSAIVAGVATWEPFTKFEGKKPSPSTLRGEVCFDGLRYTCDIDAFGLPIVPTALVNRLIADMRARREKGAKA